MKYKIGIFGSAEGNFDQIIEKAHTLGVALGKRRITIITGASTGLPYEVAYKANKYGAKVWGYSPTLNVKKQKQFAPTTDINIYDRLFFIPKIFPFAKNLDICKKYRNVVSTATCDAGIILSGRWGTMNEFTNLYDMGKVIGVLIGTGGIADELPKLHKKITKPSRAKVLFESSPNKLVERIIKILREKANH